MKIKFINYQYKIGLRVIKTAVAVALCVFISGLIHGSEILHVAAFAAITTLQQTRTETLRKGIYQALGAAIGSGIGVLFLFTNELVFSIEGTALPLVMGIGIVLVLYICNILNIPSSSTASCMQLIWVVCLVTYPLEVGLTLAGYRVLDNVIGVTVGTLTNLVFPKKRTPEDTLHETDELTDQSLPK